MKYLLYCLIPLSLTFDVMTQTVFETGSGFSIIRPALILMVLSSVIFVKTPTWAIMGVYLYCLYIFLLIFASPDVFTSLRISSKVILSFLMFPFGYYVVKDWGRLSALNRSLIISGGLFILNFLVSQYFGIGVSDYTKSNDFLLGSLADSWNIVVYILLLMPAITLTERNDQLMLSAMFVVLAILMTIGLKRIAILGVLAGYTYYAIFLFRFSFTTVVKIAFVVLLVTIGIAANYELLETRFFARGEKMGSDIVYVLQQEGRFAETLAVWGEIFRFEQPIDVLFGLTPFNSVGNYGFQFGERQLHIDYNLIVNTLGVSGLIGYFLMFALIWFQFFKLKRGLVNAGTTVTTLTAVFTCIFAVQFLTSFGGQMYSFTFRALIFLYLGAILRLLSEEKRQLRGCDD